MAKALVIQVADAVTAALNIIEYEIDFIAQRMLVPKFQLGDLKNLKVAVVPTAIESEQLTRSQQERNFSIDIGIQKLITDDNEVENLLKLVEEISNSFISTGISLDDGQNLLWYKTTNDPIYDADMLRDNKVFMSLLTVEYKALI
ncbi:MAG: hypothetical protein JEZ07_08925 [Phycisphaerae bacterium]|nr:hypothetical protein [Phycisphaerae bacterium]